MQLQPAAPAFFQYPGTSYAPRLAPARLRAGSRPIRRSRSRRGQAGDIVVLWGTGFGATDPAIPAGTLVRCAAPDYAVVTVGGVPATVISAVLSPGAAGLYQVTIQIPTAAPAGALALERVGKWSDDLKRSDDLRGTIARAVRHTLAAYSRLIVCHGDLSGGAP